MVPRVGASTAISREGWRPMNWFFRLFRAERYDPDTDPRLRQTERMTEARRERAAIYRKAREERNYLADRLVRQLSRVPIVTEEMDDAQH